MEKIVCAKCGKSISVCQDKCPVCGAPGKRVVIPASKESGFFDRLFNGKEAEDKTGHAHDQLL